MDLADYAADVRKTLAAMGISRASVMGLSMGGMVAQEFAIANPETVDRLVVAACPCTLSAEAREILGRRGAPALAGGMPAVEQETMERWFTPGFLEAGGGEQTRQTLHRTDPNAWSTAWEAIGRLDTKPRLGRVNARSLCIAGALDPASPPAAVRAIADHIRDARFLAIDDAPHMMQVETPQKLADAVDRFLREGDAS
jgi:3-oxoadipate enol-lactonase